MKNNKLKINEILKENHNLKGKIKSIEDSSTKECESLKKSLVESLEKRSRTSKKEDNGNVENRDHCNICKEGGELVCCDNCPRSFHLMCLKLKKNELPTSQWYCATCKYISHYN